MSDSVREAFYEQLRRLGHSRIFGNPGSTEEPMLSDLPADFSYVLALQEASVVAIADGYAQATGRPAVVNLHTAAGVGHAMTSILTAAQNRTPLVITAGQQTRHMLLQEAFLTNVEPTVMPQPWVKWAYQTDRGPDAPAALLRAQLIAVQPPQGPVFLSIPMDDWELEADPLPARRSVSSRTAPDPVRLAELADAIRAADRVALVVGAGVDRAGAWNGAVDLAERVAAAVFGPPSDERWGFPGDHPLWQGALPFAIAPLAEAVEGYDLVVAIGAPVWRYYPYVPGEYLPGGTALWHVSDDPSEIARAPVGDAILADPGLVISALLERLGDLPRQDAGTGAEPPAAPEITAPLTADAVFATLVEHRREHTVLVEETLSNRAQLYARWRATEPASFFTFASGALGWALPASVGIALGERDTGRDRPVMAVVGDGSLQYTVQSLWTAVQHELPLTVVVLDNQQYTILKSFAEQEDTPAVPGLNLPGVDIVKVAEGYGASAVRVETQDDIVGALAEAADRSGPSVIVIPIDRDVPELL
jgi:benzoylformate decarboxylase